MAQRPLTTAKTSVSRNTLSRKKKEKELIFEKVFDSWYHPLVVFLMKREKKITLKEAYDVVSPPLPAKYLK